MNFFKTFATIAISLIVCLVSLAQAGGDKSAKTTVSIGETIPACLWTTADTN